MAADKSSNAELKVIQQTYLDLKNSLASLEAEYKNVNETTHKLILEKRIALIEETQLYLAATYGMIILEKKQNEI
jgi:hypothetical protein